MCLNVLKLNPPFKRSSGTLFFLFKRLLNLPKDLIPEDSLVQLIHRMFCFRYPAVAFCIRSSQKNSFAFTTVDYLETGVLD